MTRGLVPCRLLMQVSTLEFPLKFQTSFQKLLQFCQSFSTFSDPFLGTKILTTPTIRQLSRCEFECEPFPVFFIIVKIPSFFPNLYKMHAHQQCVFLHYRQSWPRCWLLSSEGQCNQWLYSCPVSVCLMG